MLSNNRIPKNFKKLKIKGKKKDKHTQAKENVFQEVRNEMKNEKESIA